MTDEAAKPKRTRKAAAKRTGSTRKLPRSTAVTPSPKKKGYTPVSRRPAAPSMIAAAKKGNEAVELRLAGMTYHAIAQQLGYHDESGAYRAIMRTLTRTVPEGLEQVRQMEVRRLDAIFRGQYVAAVRGDRLAVDRCLKIMERRAALLGLDAPIRIQQMVITEEQLDEAIERIEAEATALEARSWADGEGPSPWGEDDEDDDDDGLAGVPAVVR